MNQQRSRRFRAAQEAEEEAAKEARRMAEKGITRSSTAEPKFDGNCITPGTAFMHRLAQHLRYFIAKRVSEESSWQQIEIIFSGPDVPGEGEHKIMEYIRCSKSQPDFNPNLRHCLYGLDADLILLGLLSHEPHFALLREEVLFGPASRKPRTLAQTRFFLMHLGLLRDYLDDEFRCFYSEKLGKQNRPLAAGQFMDYNSLPFPHYSVERIIDDFILMTVFVGNDFLPGLPYLHIGENAIGIMLDAYKKVLYHSNGKFMNNAGTIDFKITSKFLDELRFIEMEHFEKTGLLQKQVKSTKKTCTNRQKECFEIIRRELLENANVKSWTQKDTTPITGKDKSFVWKLAVDFNLHFELSEDRIVTLTKAAADSDDFSENEEASEDVDYVLDQEMIKKYESMIPASDIDDLPLTDREEAFMAWKAEFYSEKLHLDIKSDPTSLHPLLNSYLVGIQWNMFYYYRGVVDWAWYFPYHYGPYLTDVADYMPSFKCPEFEMGTPYSPLEQLLAVLPSASAAHVPKPFADLMTDPYSPIIDFYPKDFEQDLNGKKSPWEAVVLIPFIDEERLLMAVEGVVDQLTEEEKERNAFGSSTLFTFNPNGSEVVLAPPKSRYKSIQSCRCNVLQYDLPVLDVGFSFKPELLPGLKPVAGFPTLKNLPHRACLDSIGIALFGGKPNSSISLLLITENSQAPFSATDKTVEVLAQKLCDKQVYVNWPYLQEGIVVKLTDSLFSYEKNGKRPLDEVELKDIDRSIGRMFEDHKRLMGIELEEVDLLAWVSPFTGMKREADGSTKKTFAHANAAVPYPVQVVLPPELCIEDPRYAELSAKTLAEEYPSGSMCIYVGEDHYGCLGKVVGHQKNGLDLEICRRLPISHEPTFPHKLAMESLHQEVYYPAREVAEKLNISQLFLSKISSGWYFFFDKEMEKSSNIGLGLKFEGRGMRALGYTRRSNQSGWEYSEKALHLLSSYKKAFPEFFNRLMAVASSAQTQASSVFGPEVNVKTLQAHLAPIKSWLKQQTEGIQQIPADTVIISHEAASQIYDSWTDYKMRHPDYQKMRLTNVPSKMVLHEGMAQFTSPSNQTRFKVGDRVRYVGSGAAGVPFGVSGIILGLDGESSGSSALAHILLDEPLIGIGKTLNGLCKPNYGVSLSRRYLINLNHRSNNTPLTGPAKPAASGVESNFARMTIQTREKSKAPTEPIARTGNGSATRPAHGQPQQQGLPILNALFQAHSQNAVPASSSKSNHPVSSTNAPQFTQPPSFAKSSNPPSHYSTTNRPAVNPPPPPHSYSMSRPKNTPPADDNQAKPTTVFTTAATSRRLLKPDLTWTNSDKRHQ